MTERVARTKKIKCNISLVFSRKKERLVLLQQGGNMVQEEAEEMRSWARLPKTTCQVKHL